MSVLHESSETRPRAVDLFCGAGGASRGLHDAGFDVVGFDHWQPAVDTHNANGLKAHLHDLSDASIDETIPNCELMWLSCPCQPFSSAGDGEGEFDERDGFPWALRIVARKLPAVAIFENVKGLTFGKHHAYFAGVLESLRALGYDVDWCVLNSADFGVPQTRERCFIVCRRDGGRITWPMPTHTSPAGMFTERWVTMATALGWGRSAAVELDYRQTNRPLPVDITDRPAPCINTQSQSQWILDYRQTAGTGTPIYCDVTDRPSPTVGTMAESQWVVRTDNFTGRAGEKYRRPVDQPSPSLTTRGDLWAMESPGTEQASTIRLTIHELATLQGFPADWVWTNTKTAQARQVGNAVPPIMAQLLAQANCPVDSTRTVTLSLADQTHIVDALVAGLTKP